MSFRQRLTLVSAAAVAVAVVVASVVIFFVVRAQLRTQVDDSLEQKATEVIEQHNTEVIVTPDGRRLRQLHTPTIDAYGIYVQLVTSGGAVIARPGVTPPFRPGSDARAVASGATRGFFDDVNLNGTHVRVLTSPIEPGLAVQVARSVEEVDGSLRHLALILVFVSVGGVATAIGLGWVVSRAALSPVRNLTEATEHVTSTGDLSGRIEATGSDEVSRLASSFNAMLDALEQSLENQKQLVADASHELRTPLTSLRTNIEVLGLAHEMDELERKQLLADVVSQLEELTVLVGDLVELARGNEPVAAIHDVELDSLVRRSVDKARKRWPTVRFQVSTVRSVVRGAPDRLERALSNLLDNAGKWSPLGGVVDVRVVDGEVAVRDRGPGISDADLPHVFDRFYRAAAARQLPGSGLGLAIVKQVVEAHGGHVTVENAPDGGAVFTIQLPESIPAADAVETRVTRRG
jgi:two-component system, OmpR family, sensor histidine kinase MprB